MTLAICSYVSNHAAVPLVAMLIKLMYEAVLMADMPIAFIICNHIVTEWIFSVIFFSTILLINILAFIVCLICLSIVMSHGTQ